MKCEHAIDLVIDSLMDSLDADQQRLLEQHLATCVACAGQAETMRWSWDALGRIEAPATSVPPIAVTAQVSGPRPWWRAAAAIALFVLGGATGFGIRSAGSEPGAAAGPTFLLLVRGENPAGIPSDTLVREYGEWAAELAADGRLVAAEKLTDEAGRWVSGSAMDTRDRSDVSGYFVVTASDYDQAAEIASSSPHVRYGGTFEIRRIDRLQ